MTKIEIFKQFVYTFEEGKNSNASQLNIKAT